MGVGKKVCEGIGGFSVLILFYFFYRGRGKVYYIFGLVSLRRIEFLRKIVERERGREWFFIIEEKYIFERIK